MEYEGLSFSSQEPSPSRVLSQINPVTTFRTWFLDTETQREIEARQGRFEPGIFSHAYRTSVTVPDDLIALLFWTSYRMSCPPRSLHPSHYIG